MLGDGLGPLEGVGPAGRSLGHGGIGHIPVDAVVDDGPDGDGIDFRQVDAPLAHLIASPLKRSGG